MMEDRDRQMSGREAANHIERMRLKRLAEEEPVLLVEQTIIDSYTLEDLNKVLIKRSVNLPRLQKIARHHLRLLSGKYVCAPGNHEQIKYKNKIDDIRSWTSLSLTEYLEWMETEFRGFLLADELGIL